jgi:hypothetical protein
MGSRLAASAWSIFFPALVSATGSPNDRVGTGRSGVILTVWS